MRLVYLGTPEAAVPPLRALCEAGHEVALVVSGPDRRRGRGGAMSPSPVKAAALELGLPVTDQVDDLLEVEADLGVVVAFGQILRKPILDRLPLVNLHFSLLPRWRGAAPVERALLAGDGTTGVCVMEVAEGLDTGAVFAREEVTISERETAESLRNRLVAVGSAMLVQSLSDGLSDPSPQAESGVTYARKITAQDLFVDWTAPAVEVDRLVRIGGAWTTFRGARLKIIDAAPVPADEADVPGSNPEEIPNVPGFVGDGPVVRCGGGLLQLIEVGPEGKRAMAATVWANGAQPTGAVLGEGLE